MEPRTFKVGDRIAYDNIGGESFGEIKAVHPSGYEVKWDDGFVDEADYYYDGYELRPEGS
jgi:hypothetical protein